MMRSIIPLLIIAILAGTILVVGADVRSSAREIADVRAELQFRAEANEHLATLKQNYEKAKPSIPSLENRVPPFSALENFENDFRAIARQNNVTLRAFTLGSVAPSENATPGEVLFTANAEGTYAALLELFNGLSESRYPVALDSVELFRQARTRTFSALMEGKVFFQ